MARVSQCLGPNTSLWDNPPHCRLSKQHSWLCSLESRPTLLPAATKVSLNITGCRLGEGGSEAPAVESHRSKPLLPNGNTGLRDRDFKEFFSHIVANHSHLQENEKIQNRKWAQEVYPSSWLILYVYLTTQLMSR